METNISPPLHTRVPLRRTWPNRAFALVYFCAILALLYHHFLNLLIHYYSSNHSSLFITISMLVADLVLAFMWFTYQGFRMSPVRREVFPENLSGEFPGLDVFICTADPEKEPPMGVLNTAISAMALDYPMEKLSVYVSDDGGSEVTLFAFMEGAKFARHWLPYCREYNIMERCPHAYFGSDPELLPHAQDIKLMYESMKMRVENVVNRGKLSVDELSSELEIEAFSKWTDEFTPQDHPSVIQVVLESERDKDVSGQSMPNLIYVSRQKNKVVNHRFKAGALNVLLRVSGTMTNAPVVLTLDCDMYCNDPKTPHRALCYLLDPSINSTLAYVQFPQIFRGINEHDTYAAAFKYIFQIDPHGMDGLGGPIHVGTNCFFQRRAFFGTPTSLKNSDLSPYQVVETKSIKSKEILAKAYLLAGCNYENQTKWGSEMGYKYGSLVEDFYTCYLMHCQGWKSVFCNPKRVAFFGEVPMTLDDLLNQTKRWSMGLLDVSFSDHKPITYGIGSLNLFWALCYTHYSMWPIWFIPITIYAFLPQLALLNSFSIFPKVTDPWFLLYVFLALGAYGQDYITFMLHGGTTRKWWNNQRMWIIRGISSYSFGFIEYMLKSLGIKTVGFNITSKVFDNDLNKRYEKGIFEFGTTSTFFLPITMAAIINFVSFVWGSVVLLLRYRSLDDMFLQMFMAGFAVVNGWPVYEAMVLRADKGRMPMKITLISMVLAWVFYLVSSLVF